MFNLLLKEIISEIIQIVLKYSFNKIKENIKEDKIEQPKEARLEKKVEQKEAKTEEPKKEIKTVEEKSTCIADVANVTDFNCVEKFIMYCFEKVRNENPQYKFIYIILQSSFDRINYVNIRLVDAISTESLDFSITDLYFTPINKDSEIFIKIKLKDACEMLLHKSYRERLTFESYIGDKQI